ncbi:FosX/FosE/FosI family fosfomycin resistance thiol transferase [Rhodanobacter sp. 7MK24]|uniref:FosX/FosE/FosI family fosfomycin resistance hydrolase n=1 Tax=Rhodanobacter sp. 7MK24 TaxID=2775922 RepID=UPI0017801606|nr:FosX/FosE/FosI family fosfomycin resistance hydrolase [Rhodanobacter sp. 7MK24]MBD8880767.1 FosX/FosE/FosI family fosfomycin resistance thiol transferase [Rhodanobacter sp. 7MK24]
MHAISHITFMAHDLDRMKAVLCEVLGAREIYDSIERNFSLSREKFFLLNGLWIAVMEGDSRERRSYEHVAFRVNREDLAACIPKIEAMGLDILPPRPRKDGEGESLYFYDFDNHLFELHTGTLEERLACYGKLSPAEEC